VNTVAWLGLLSTLVPALALAAPKTRPPVKKPVPAKKPGKDTATEPAAPAPADAPADKDKPAEPPAAVAPTPAGGGGGGGGGGASTGGGTSGGADASTRSADPAAGAAGTPADKPGDGPDVDSLRQEYLSLRDELFKSRARANAVASQLYSTRIQVKLTYTTGRYYNPAKSSIRLDGANVYEDTTGAIAGDDGVRFDGYVAPGRHLVTFRVEATGKDDDSFTSMTESQIVVKAVAGKDLIVAAKARDSGDIAYEWKRTEKGSYGLGIDVAVRTAKPAEGAPAPTATAPSPAKGASK
jgi:hypothetical protein